MSFRIYIISNSQKFSPSLIQGRRSDSGIAGFMLMDIKAESQRAAKLVTVPFDVFILPILEELLKRSKIKYDFSALQFVPQKWRKYWVL